MPSPRPGRVPEPPRTRSLPPLHPSLPPRTRSLPALHPRLQRTVPGASLAEPNRAGSGEGTSQPISVGSQPLLSPSPFRLPPQAAAICPAWAGIPSGVCQQSSLRWQWESSLSNGTNCPSSNTELIGSKTIPVPAAGSELGSQQRAVLQLALSMAHFITQKEARIPQGSDFFQTG